MNSKNIFNEFFEATKDAYKDLEEAPEIPSTKSQSQLDAERIQRLHASENQINWFFMSGLGLGVALIFLFCPNTYFIQYFFPIFDFIRSIFS